MESLALILFLVPLAWSPGPGNLFFAALGANAGLKGSWPASIGYHGATWIVTLAIGFGFGVAAGSVSGVSQAIALAGGAYVLWLASKFWRAGRRTGPIAVPSARVLDGVVLLVLNPKAYAIIAAMFAQFLGADASVTQIVWITTLFTLNNLVAFTVWTWAGDRMLRRWQDRTSALVMNRAAALSLVTVAVWMALR